MTAIRERDVDREPALIVAMNKLGGVMALAQALHVTDGTAGIWFDLPKRYLSALTALTGQAPTDFRAGRKRTTDELEWTTERVDLLRSVWSTGLTVAEIARQFGVTKNAIVGKVHRLRLPGRSSPIRRVARSPQPAPRRPRNAPTVVAAENRRAEITPAIETASPQRSKTASSASSASLAVDAVSTTPASVVATNLTDSRRQGQASCTYPIGDPRSAGFRFCDEPALDGRRYCGRHHALCHLPIAREPPRFRLPPVRTNFV